ncbi:hypothetical protein [Rubellimicrobium roseum]|uniref:DUF3489 domain-containing protein n=1 Tax=Rubellimicrobium roseum TaxID=687525 RepID=A0A5C4NM00_9RHOB|nr:hypothetical protein [Rubellimicrobium roseum]TNC74146.1 hypothetical protein FHG71_02840 [Rubellimicrobium roseum]
MLRYQFHHLTDAHVVSVLHHMRAAILRDERDGLAHVDALLRQYGVDPATLPIPRKVPKHFKRGTLRRGILDALRSGPLTAAQIAAVVAPDLPRQAARARVSGALSDMKAAGWVRLEGMAGRYKWRLA